MKDSIRTLIHDALETAHARNRIDLQDFADIPIEVSRTKDPKFGDYASNCAMVLAGKAKMKPREIAAIIADHLTDYDQVLEKTEIAGPGFLNFFLSSDTWRGALRDIHEMKESYGGVPQSGSRRTLLEFVSANPTGPLHVGHGRGAAVGDTLARLLRARGYGLDTEYYVNDVGNQMRILGRSVFLRYRELKGEEIAFPDDHYRGGYITDMARDLIGSPLGTRLERTDEDEAVAICSKYAADAILKGIEEDLRLFGVTYDRYFSERTLHDEGRIGETLDILRARGRAEERDGALWFSMEGDEDEKDRVLVRTTGEPTYFAADAAYHRDKVERGYHRLIDIWGSDHHGYVPRVKAAMQALGHLPDALTVLLVQFVTLVRGGEKVSMSTRSGEFVTLREVLDEVGADAARFFFLTKRCDSHLDFDLDLAKKQSRDNPVYYVQYMHARISSIFRIAAERGVDADMTDPDLDALDLPEEERIIKHLAHFPDMLAEAAHALEPHRITFYLFDLADLFHAYYHDNKVLTEDPRIKKARLYLVWAIKQVTANGLEILGVSAPERM